MIIRTLFITNYVSSEFGENVNAGVVSLQDDGLVIEFHFQTSALGSGGTQYSVMLLGRESE